MTGFGTDSVVIEERFWPAVLDRQASLTDVRFRVHQSS
jgi:hypothetical protein